MARRGQSAGQIFNFDEDSYLERTSRPLYAVTFLLPFIVFYELGTIFVNTNALNESQVRVAAFVWLEELMMYLGFSGKVVWAMPAAAAVVILLSIHAASRKRWQVSLRDMVPMGIECVLFSVPLVVLSLFLNSSSPQSDVQAAFACAAGGGGVHGFLADIVTGIGAGIYEELVFRLILICLLMMILQDVLRMNHGTAMLLSVLVSAALFSGHHHIVFFNGILARSSPFEAKIFVFRTLAGVYFAFIFAMRGFGITAGTHAFYDIIATLINAMYFD